MSNLDFRVFNLKKKIRSKVYVAETFKNFTYKSD